ncbi:hypothetical protein ABZV80_39845 [Streptomyces sp. NPDC005132]|uniref:hypothetical protein n=1 Tax=Streptomyces sp. NPDC005132 TaxID=3154294 RepID=UPI0033A22BCE
MGESFNDEWQDGSGQALDGFWPKRGEGGPQMHVMESAGEVGGEHATEYGNAEAAPMDRRR